MINQTVSVNNSPYKDFNGYNKNPQFIMHTPPAKPEEEKNSYAVAYSIGISALIIGFGILGLMKGTPKNFIKHLEKLKGWLENKIEKSKHAKSLEWVTKGYTYALNKVNYLIVKSEAVNNFTSVKDSLLKFFMDKTKPTKALHRWITKQFTKASRATVKNSWTNTNHKFEKNFENLKDIDKKILAEKAGEIIEINGVKKTGQEWIDLISQHKKNILSILGENSSASSLAQREKEMMEATTDLDKLVIGSIRRYKKPALFKDFITDKAITASKEKMMNKMRNFRQAITMNAADSRNLAVQYLRQAENLLLNEDPKLLQQITSLKTAIKNDAPQQDILKALDEISKHLKDCKIKPKIQNKTLNSLSQVKLSLESRQKGEMQELLAIYKKLAPDDYEKVVKEMSSSVNALDKSIDIEGKQYFEKLRDLQVGSAPTDVLSVVGSGGYIAYALHGNKDRQEKISVMLKQGIPVLSTIGVSLLCTARLISGTKAMAIGLISGLIMNKIGTFTDNFMKKKLSKPETTPKAV